MSKPNYLFEVLEKMEEDRGELLEFCLEAKVLDLNTVITNLVLSKNPKHIYYFLIRISSFPFDDIVLPKIKIENNCYKTAEYAQKKYEVIKEIASKLINLLIEIKSARYIYALAKCKKEQPNYFSFINMDVLIEGILKTDDARTIYSFAESMKPNCIERFEKRIIELQDARAIYFFAKYYTDYIPNASIKELIEGIIRTKDAKWITYFASYIPNTPTKRLEDEVISLNDAESIYCFAKNIKGASIEKLTEAIVSTNDIKYITLFAQEIENSDLTLLIKSLMRLNAFYELVEIANQFPNYASPIASFILETKNLEVLRSCSIYFKDQSINEKIRNEYDKLLEEKKSEEENAPFNRLVVLSKNRNFRAVKDEFELFQGLFVGSDAEPSNIGEQTKSSQALQSNNSQVMQLSMF